jgi:hypothetical protein
MKALSKKEIRTELKRIGIHKPADIERYLREYKMYYSRQLPHKNSAHAK